MKSRKVHVLSAFLWSLFLTLACVAHGGTASAHPILVSKVELGIDTPSPLRGWMVIVDLSDPGIEAAVLPAGENALAMDEVTPQMRLATPSAAASRHDLDVTMNASFFGVTHKKRVGNRDISYFVGNPAFPVGWHVSHGHTVTKPKSERLRATLILTKQRSARVEADLKELPEDALHAVSGNALLVRGGVPTPNENPATAPRSAVGVSADGKTLYLLVVDGRQPGHSVGASMAQLSQILHRQGATDAVNLDGGGSTTLVLRDPATGVQVVANRPSDPLQTLTGRSPTGLLTERPVVDVIGIRWRPADKLRATP